MATNKPSAASGGAATRFPEKGALEVWGVDGLACSIYRTEMGHLCGYVRFPKRPTIETGYDGILTYVPVHGGITYAREDDDGSMVYGFDCAHSGDAPPIDHETTIGLRYRDPNAHVWTTDEVRVEVEKMARGIAVAAKFEERYLLARDNETKSAVIEEFTDELERSKEVTYSGQLTVVTCWCGIRHVPDPVAARRQQFIKRLDSRYCIPKGMEVIRDLAAYLVANYDGGTGGHYEYDVLYEEVDLDA